jgi:hypothetical protein
MPKLRVNNIDIVPGEIKKATIELKITTYVKNYEESSSKKTSKNLSVVLRAISLDKHFLANETRAALGKLAAGKTVNFTRTMILPKKGGYTIEALLYEDEEQVDSGNRVVYDLQDIPADSRSIGLRVDGIDFLIRSVTGENVSIQNDIYITNMGQKPSSDMRLMIKATELDSSIVADKRWSQTGEILPEETAIRTVNLTVPDKYNYVVAIEIWRNGTIVAEGSDYIFLNATTRLENQTRLASKGTRTGSFASSAEEASPSEMRVGNFEGAAETKAAEGPKGMPGFEVFMAMPAFAIAAYLMRRNLKL